MKYLVEAQCGLCGTWDRTLVDYGDHHRYQMGELVQDVWPNMPTDDREVIVGARTGYYVCPECWGNISDD